MRLGVCYYPEHWPEERWAEDARAMVALGLTRVRLGEFAWSRIEPESGRFEWGWLDRAVDTLAGAGLGIILSTPTATPPKWLVDSMPDMLAIDARGRPRRFGSRRHYCFSHLGYRRESRRITTAVAGRYGRHEAIVAWQTDNEYGCHDTVLSYSAAAEDAFRVWLEARYGSVEALNAAWGTVFWSQEYRSFSDVEMPFCTVTEANPAHRLAFRRFSSDQVVAFNREQTDILRAKSPGRDVTHNFMGFFTEFDHQAVAAGLDVASWDSYPLGFLDSFSMFGAEEKRRYARTGHPDIAAFHHDLYRGVGRGRWWVMEQQPGPVNWSAHNPAPAAGMVRLWTLEAAAHGAELVSYFRWRQFPHAQEQMHAGLLRPDNVEAEGAAEVRTVAAQLSTLGDLPQRLAPVALLFDYTAPWVTKIQPQGRDFDALELCFRFYEALRRLGLDVDIVPPEADLRNYSAIVVPCLPIMSGEAVARLDATTAPMLLGPRTGSKTAEFALAPELPPGVVRRWLPLKVTRVESLPPGCVEPGPGFSVARWLEHCETALQPELTLDSGVGVLWRHGRTRYLSAWPDEMLLGQALSALLDDAGVAVTPLPPDLRLRRAGRHCFAFNYGPHALSLAEVAPADARYTLGGPVIGPAGVAAWETA